MGKEYHGHMYTKTIQWELDRRANLEMMRQNKPDHDIEEMRDRPNVINKKSIKIIREVD